MDKRIGIVTWYANLNYGGTLQAYALQKVIDSFGLDSEFINYQPERRTILYKAQRWAKDIVISCYKPRLYWSRKKICSFVRENLRISPPYETYAELRTIAEERYSAAICGSDQIWSNIGGEINPLYYLTFIDESKRIAYAPSIGYNQVPFGIEDDFGKYVNAIRFLSVREKHGAKLIRSITGRDARVVLDPSLLLTKSQWEREIKLAGKRPQKSGHIFCYFLGKNPEYAQYVGRLSQYTGYPAIGIESKFLSLGSIKKVAADPFDFLALLNNATFVLTDSFHGVAFSINFGKQFAVFKRFEDSDPINQNSRIYNILEKTGLEQRLISTHTPPRLIVDDSIDYASVYLLLDKERRQSTSYLRNAISSVIDGGNETDFQ